MSYDPIVQGHVREAITALEQASKSGLAGLFGGITIDNAIDELNNQFFTEPEPDCLVSGHVFEDLDLSDV